MKRMFFLLFILLFGACTSKHILRHRLLSEDPAQYTLDHSDDDAAAIVLEDKAEVEIFGTVPTGGSSFRRHRVLHIRKPRGLMYASVAIPFGQNSRIISLQARTITPQGTQIELQAQDLYEIDAYPQFIFYSDRRAKLFAFPGVETGSILEYAYEVEITDQMLWPAWSFQEDIPVKQSVFTITAPSTWPLNFRVYGDSVDFSQQKSAPGFKSTYTWTARDMKARRIESAMPPWRETTTWLSIAPESMTTWEDVRRWYHELALPQAECNHQMKTLVQGLIKDLSSPIEICEVIYNWVRDHIRYIAVSIGIGSYQPHPAAVTFRNRYGDCKDMVTLIIAMAKEAGVEVHPVLISTRQNGALDPTLASPLVFNHLIAWAPKLGMDGIWMDATAKGIPFGRIPWSDQNCQVLIADMRSDDNFITTPSFSEQNGIQKNIRIAICDNKQAGLQFDGQWFGDDARILRQSMLQASQREMNHWILQALLPPGMDGEVSSYTIQGMDPIRDPLTLQAEILIEPMAGDDEGFDLDPLLWFIQSESSSYSEKGRQHPLQLSYNRTIRTQVQLSYPAGWELAQWPVPLSTDSPFGHCRWSRVRTDSTFQIKQEWHLEKEIIAVEDYTDFRTFIKTTEGRRPDRLHFDTKK